MNLASIFLYIIIFQEEPNDTAVFRSHGERDVSGEILLVLVVARGDDAHRAFLAEADDEGKLDVQVFLLDVAEIPTVLDLLERGRRELHQDGLPDDVVLVLELLRADLEARGS